MRLEVGELYYLLRYLIDRAPPEKVIFKVLDFDFDRHKGFYEYKIQILNPRDYDKLIRGKDCILWINPAKESEIYPLPEEHPAWLLYGPK